MTFLWQPCGNFGRTRKNGYKSYQLPDEITKEFLYFDRLCQI